MNWYERKSAQLLPLDQAVSESDLNTPDTPFITSLNNLPPGYTVRREANGGWTILNPDKSVLVDTEATLPTAIKLALIRINLKLSQQQSLQRTK